MTASVAAANALRIVPVAGKAAIKRFIEVPNRVLAADPAWISPLLLERRMHLSPRTNPYFRHARWQAWMAVRGDTPVGRISAQIDDLQLQRYADATGFFGMLDAEDDADTFNQLLHTAEEWLREQGMRRVRGPFSLSINDETGVLVDGFDTPPVFMMGHARPYYAARIEQAGYHKAKDTLAFMVATDFKAPRVMQRLLAASMKRIRIHPLDRAHFDENLEVLRDIFNDAWAGNWGFLPFTHEEFEDMGRSLKLLLVPELIQVAEVDGEPAGFIVAMPNINEIIRNFHGHLLPFGWAKLLWGLKVRFPHTARVPLMGVRRKFHDTRLGPGLAFLMIDTVRRHLAARGVKDVETSWVLEDNAAMCDIIKAIGGVAYKRYRVYERALA